MARKGSNRKKCGEYAARHGGGKRHHFGRRHKPLSITGIVSGLPLPGELKTTYDMLARSRRADH